MEHCLDNKQVKFIFQNTPLPSPKYPGSDEIPPRYPR